MIDISPCKLTTFEGCVFCVCAHCHWRSRSPSLSNNVPTWGISYIHPVVEMNRKNKLSNRLCKTMISSLKATPPPVSLEKTRQREPTSHLTAPRHWIALEIHWSSSCPLIAIRLYGTWAQEWRGARWTRATAPCMCVLDCLFDDRSAHVRHSSSTHHASSAIYVQSMWSIYGHNSETFINGNQ